VNAKTENKVSFVLELDIEVHTKIKRLQKLEGLQNRDFLLFLIDKHYGMELLRESRLKDLGE